MKPEKVQYLAEAIHKYLNDIGEDLHPVLIDRIRRVIELNSENYDNKIIKKH